MYHLMICLCSFLPLDEYRLWRSSDLYLCIDYATARKTRDELKFEMCKFNCDYRARYLWANFFELNKRTTVLSFKQKQCVIVCCMAVIG